MDLRQLNYFLVLAEELHFGRAAERLNMSQPPLSRMIQQLESDLGVRLFERTKRSVMLTAAGVELLQDAKQLVLQMQTVKKRLTIFGKGETGTLKIGYVGAVMHTELPKLLAVFATEYPHINLQFEEQRNSDLVHGLNNGILDAAFVRTWLHSEDLDERVIFNEQFVAILPLKHPLAKKAKLAIQELKNENFITFTRECGPTIFDNFLALCANAGFTPHISHDASQLNSVLRLVESNFGVSILPKSTEMGFKLKLKFTPLINAKETVPLIMLTRKRNVNPALAHLKEQLQKMMTRIAVILVLLLGMWTNACAQDGIKGRVVDKGTKEPLEAAVVTDASTGQNTITDKNGRFTLKERKKADSLIISFIGYTAVKISPKDKDLTIELEKGAVDLKTVVITRQSNNLTSSLVLSSIDLNMRPVKSAQDLLRLIPGLFIAQHQGGGKAEQIFLRGFDADHGTDVNVSVDGMPVNMVSHAHGQGYADLHFLIPETVSGYDFGKGPYYTDKGDFTTAGYVAYHTHDVLDRSMVKIEGGQYNTLRGVAMLDLLPAAAKLQGTSAYLAAEGLYSDGPFHLQEHFNRGNLFGKFTTPLGTDTKLTVEASTLSSIWRASGEIPNRAVPEGYMKDRFGAIDSFQGGNTTRTNAMIKLSSKLGNRFTWDNEAFYTRYFFNLISNFTFYYFYPATGDEFGQHEKRNMGGYTSKLSRQDYFDGVTLTSSAGIGIRYDRINPSWLSHTLHGDTILNYIQLGNTRETNINGYLDETLVTGPWLFNAGVRVDDLHFEYDNQAPVNDSTADIFVGVSPRAAKAIVSPKIDVQYTASPEIQLYIKTGKGFHSNDVRIVIANQGYRILPAAYGADLGIDWKPLPRLFINTALWYLYLQQEFTYGADLGDVSVSPGGRTRREGIDFSARYQITDWLFANLNIDLARPRALDSAKGNNYLPLAPTFTSTGALDFRFKNGINGGISYRYLHDRAANSDYSLTALGYFLGDLTVNYTKKKYEIGLAIENLFNQEWNESQFEYVSRLKYETRPVDQVSYTPGAPFFARAKLSVFF